MSKEYKYEIVSYEPSRLNNGEFIPRISVVSNNDGATEESREFQADDLPRVLDFDNMPEPPPNDTIFGHLEFELDDDDTVAEDAPPKFPNRYFVLRGSFIFYFSLDDVDGLDNNTDGATQRRHHNQIDSPKIRGKPLGVIPLERTKVEFPPGGRRCFREHAQTEARNGYEMMIRHMGRAGTGSSGGGVTSKRRAPAYIVAETSGQRESWKKAIVDRADVHKKDTKLRPTGATNISNEAGDSTIGGQQLGRKVIGRGSPLRGEFFTTPTERRIGGNISVLAGVLEPEEQKDIDAALEEFGNSAFFEESGWVNHFFEQNDEYESLTASSKLERWQTSIKKGLRGAVLEQYEYFVEASKSMTIMGREIATLKELTTRQVDVVESMKHVSFDLGALVPNKQLDRSNLDYPEDEEDAFSSDDEGDGKSNGGSDKLLTNDSWDFDSRSPRKASKIQVSHGKTTAIVVPEWLDEVVEEISAFIKESRYSDATDLLLKAKNEINEIINQHEQLTEKKLPKKQFATIQRILRSIDNLTTRLCDHLTGSLRRKNDAFRVLQKKERNDPHLVNAPLVSPIALNDDAPTLHLLVKLGKPLCAATAYTARRSLLLSECLHERPICHTSHSVDIVIYAAQLSHSFFSSLAVAVEGFLDLYADTDKSNISDDNSEASSINTGSLKTVPANALAATCLWCDSETSKFATVFGTKILNPLNLSPRVVSANAISDKISKFEMANDLTNDKIQLRKAEEMGEAGIAANLRKKIVAMKEQEDKKDELNQAPTSAEKDRKAAIEIAAKCVDQAFTFAHDCVAIGLPLTPRLAEYLRPRLKGAEAEIAMELDKKWDQVTFYWKESDD